MRWPNYCAWGRQDSETEGKEREGKGKSKKRRKRERTEREQSLMVRGPEDITKEEELIFDFKLFVLLQLKSSSLPLKT